MSERRYRASVIGFILGLAAIVISAFGIAAWFISEATSTTTLTLLVVTAVIGVVACAFHLWSRAQRVAVASGED